MTTLDVSPSTLMVGGHLRSSWIFDNAPPNHICNDTMKDRFVKVRDSDGSTLQGQSIIAYGTIVLDVGLPTKGKGKIPRKGTITLTNVAYIPNFTANLVSGNILEDKGNLYIDARRRCLERDGVPIFSFTQHGSYRLIEDNSDLTPTLKPTEGVEDITKQHQQELASLAEHWQQRQEAWQQKNESKPPT